MALNTPRILGNQLTVTCAGAQTLWRDFSIDFKENTEDASAADSIEDEQVTKRIWLEGKCSGWLGATNNGGTLPQRGDSVDDLAVAVGSDTVLPSLDAYNNIKVTDVSYNFSDGLASFSFSFRSGRLN